jgi:signal transduction histidine kinase
MSRQFETPKIRQWYWAGAICGGIGLFEATQTVFSMRSAGMHHQWAALFFTVLLAWVPWAAAAPLIIRLAQEYPLFRRNTGRAWARHLGMWLAVAVTAALWNAAIQNWLDPYVPDIATPGFVPMLRNKFSTQLLATVLLYAVIVVVGWMRQQMEASQLNEQLAKAQLSALRQQIEPHFLFNSLNSIAALVREGASDRAVDMLVRLSDLLRYSLQTTHRQQIELGEELEAVGKYLEIEKTRFAERLRVRIDVPPSLLNARVPSLILQPLVENAVKHGIAKRMQGGAIEISATRSNGNLILCVSNDGQSFAQHWEKKGIGLQNVRERLATLYGKAADLQVANTAEGAAVRVTVPLRQEANMEIVANEPAIELKLHE